MAVLGPAARVGLARLAPVALALGVMILLARLMVHPGMVEALARAAAGLGLGWPVLEPALGALGTFVTGSATASNVRFGPHQADAAATPRRPRSACWRRQAGWCSSWLDGRQGSAALPLAARGHQPRGPPCDFPSSSPPSPYHSPPWQTLS
jgi:hypothetical protein